MQVASHSTSSGLNGYVYIYIYVVYVFKLLSVNVIETSERENNCKCEAMKFWRHRPKLLSWRHAVFTPVLGQILLFELGSILLFRRGPSCAQSSATAHAEGQAVDCASIEAQAFDACKAKQS